MGNFYVVFDWDSVQGRRGRRKAIVAVAPNQDGVTQASFSVSSSEVVAVQTDANGTESPASGPTSLQGPGDKPSPLLLPANAYGTSFVYTCGLATVMRGHQPGDSLRLYSQYFDPAYLRYEVPSAFGTADYVPAGAPGPFFKNEVLHPVVIFCGQSFVGPLAYVQDYPLSPLLAPGLDPASLLPGATRLQVRETVPGAVVTASVERGGSIATASDACVLDCSLGLPTGFVDLREGDTVSVGQRLCTGSDSVVTTTTVKGCGDVPPPSLARTPVHGDSSVALSGYAPGASVIVFVTAAANPSTGLVPIGHAPAAATVLLSRPLAPPDRFVVVAQSSSVCPPVAALAFGIGE